MKQSITKILVAALAVAAVSAFAIAPVYATNTVITDGTWVGSDHVAADTAHGIEEQSGTAIRTNHQITVTNVQDAAANLDVTAYQVIKGTYKDGKLTGYVLVDSTNASIAAFETPTVAEIATIANNIRSNATTLQGIKMTKGTGAQSNQYTANVEAGLYVVLATGADAYVYNPALVAVNVSDSDDIDDEGNGNDGKDKNGVSHDTVSMLDYWTIPTQAYLKSSTTSFNKDIVGAQTRSIVNPENTEGDIVAKGDRVYFKLDGMTIPSYSDDYAKPNGSTENGVVYQIDDKLDGVSFAGISNLTVQTVVGATKTTVPATTAVDDDNDPATPDVTVTNYTVVYKNAAGETVTGDDIAKSAVSYTIKFDDAWIRANAEKGVEVTYESNLTENATVNYQANKTVATLSYTVDPSDNTGVEVLRDTTYHYTFELGGEIDGSANSKVKNGTSGDEVDSFDAYEVNKVTEALANGSSYTPDGTTGEYASEHALAGAEFTLYDDDAFTTIHQLWDRTGTDGAWASHNAVYTTTANGHVVFSGLDTGTYYLKETAAPEGYTLNNNDYKIVIAGTIADGTGAAEEGTLTGYTVTVYVKGTDGNYTNVVGTSTFTAVPTVTKPQTDATALNYDTVTNVVTLNAVPAEVVDTPLAVLPSTGGPGTIALTLIAAGGMAGFLTLYIVNKKKKSQTDAE